MTNAPDQTKRAVSRSISWRETVRFLFSLILVAALILLTYSLGIVLCPLKRFTGVPCPTCGSTRAVLSALHGDFAKAFALQPLVMTLVIASGPIALAAKLSQKAKRLLISATHHPLTWFIAALALIANWIYVIKNGN